MPYKVEKLTKKELEQTIQMYKNKIERLGNTLKELYTLAPCLITSPSDEVKFLINKLERLKDKLSACEKELFKRKKGGSAESKLRSPRFVDVTKATGTLTGTVTFTQNSTTVTGVGTLFLTELAVGNYIKPSTSGYDEWYRIESIETDTSLTLSWAFAQPTVTDPADSTLYNAEDGTSPTTAFCHLRQATTDEVRVAGDIIYLRRGQTHLYQAIDIIFDEDGTIETPIILMGDDGTGWADETGLSAPILDFGGATKHAELIGDICWSLKDLEIINSAHIYGNLRLGFAHYTKCEKVIIRLCQTAERGAVMVGPFSFGLVFVACEFYSNTDTNAALYDEGSDAKFINCKFDGGDPPTSKNGLALASNTYAELINCDFGVTIAHTTSDIAVKGKCLVKGRNVNLASPTKIGGLTIGARYEAYVKIEDYGGTKLDNRAFYWQGNIIRDTTVVRVGGAPSSARMEPNANCSLEAPLKLCAFTEELSRWLEAGTRSVKMYLRGSGWTVLPTADELYVEVHYYDGVTAKRAVKKSTATLPANDVWTEFPIDFVLNSDSPCYVNVILKKYEAGARIYVDILPEWG